MSTQTGLSTMLGLLGALASCGPDPDDGSDLYDPFEREVAHACNDACFLDHECTGANVSECIPDCYQLIEHMTPPRPPCDSAWLAFFECQGTLECDELAALKSNEPNPCSERSHEVGELCD